MIANMITAYITERTEFQLTSGYQPIDSLFYLQKGAFSTIINGTEHVVRAGNIAIFNSETPMIRHVLEPITFLYIKYSIQKKTLFEIPTQIFYEISSRALADIQEILKLCDTHAPFTLDLQTHYFNDLLLSLMPYSQADACASRPLLELPSALESPIAYLREHFAEKLSLDEVARQSGMSVSSLEAKFKAMLGISPYQYLILLRLEYATKLLTETAYSVTEIASRCGYEYLFYFCNAFKKQFGMTPSQYRSKNQI
ncbi:MAG: helix-turn-helix transcriptional regulator [Ruminococcaceae bacterium]|nr:helix-turn-helix transcriptional regulator [Oscillospiraceae bacterium]